jgi:hypothetical protein
MTRWTCVRQTSTDSSATATFQRHEARECLPREQAIQFQGTTQDATQNTTQKLLELVRRHPLIARRIGQVPRHNLSENRISPLAQRVSTKSSAQKYIK